MQIEVSTVTAELKEINSIILIKINYRQIINLKFWHCYFS